MLTLNDFKPTPLGWLNRMPFGKYQGWRIRQIWAEDPEYLDWALDEVEQFNLEAEVHDQVRIDAEQKKQAREFDTFLAEEFYE